MRTIQKYYRIDRSQISFLKFIIEAYEGTAMVRTIDPEDGIVALHIAPGCEPVVDMILTDLKQEIMIEGGSTDGFPSVFYEDPGIDAIRWLEGK